MTVEQPAKTWNTWKYRVRALVISNVLDTLFGTFLGYKFKMNLEPRFALMDSRPMPKKSIRKLLDIPYLDFVSYVTNHNQPQNRGKITQPEASRLFIISNNLVIETHLQIWGWVPIKLSYVTGEISIHESRA